MESTLYEIQYKEIMKNYQKDKSDLKKTIDDFREIISLYKKEFPYRYLSHYRLEKFYKLMRRLCLVPDIDVFTNISKNNELYDADVFFLFYTKEQSVTIKIPFVINITKLNDYLESREEKRVIFTTAQLQQIIKPECFEEYEMDMAIKKLGGDLLETVKSKNHVMVMKDGKANDTFLINGTHRTIGAIKDGVKEIEGYYVSPEVCSHFALSSDFEELYGELLKLYRRVHIGKNKTNKK
ncbi:hypothetical protein [Amedibacillus sp. YH-ame10]